MSKGDKVLFSSSEYLKKRNIDERLSDEADKKALNITSEEHAGLHNLIDPSSPNAFSFSATTSQYPFIDQQYIRLKSWMTETSEPCRTELSQVLFPLFVHLYIELLSGAGRNAAKAFFNRHHQVFRVNRDYEHILWQVCNTGEAVGSPVIQSLRSGKYCVRLSELTLNYFLRYLQTSGNPTLLQIFNNYIEVEISEMSGSVPMAVFKGPDLADGSAREVNGTSRIVNSHDVDCSADESKELLGIISNVRTMKPVMPSLCVYSVFNANNGLSCAKVDNDCRVLACGFEDSVIKLWRLSSQTQMNLDSDAATTPSSMMSQTQEEVLFCNVLANDDEEEEEESRSVGGRHISGGEFSKLRGHMGPIFDVSFTHNSSHLFSVGEDSAMRLWDLREGRTVAIYQGHNYPIWCVDVSPQTMYIATGSYDGTARIWTSECTYPLRTLCGHAGSVDCVDFHPNCTYLATGSKDRSIRLWQITDSSVCRIFTQHDSPVNCLSFSPNGKYLASGSEAGEVHLWDLAAGKVLSQSTILTSEDSTSGLKNSVGSIASVCWTQDSSMIISASCDGSIRASHITGTGSPELIEVDNVVCGGGSHSGGITLVHSSVNKLNFLTAVVAVHGER